MICVIFIEKLLTDMDLSEEYTVDNFRKKLQAENIEKTSLIKLKVKDKEPQRAAEIANSWVIVFTNAIDESIQNHLEKMLKTISSRVESDEKDYIRISQEIESFHLNMASFGSFNAKAGFLKSANELLGT